MTEAATLGVVIVDDQHLIRTGFSLILGSDPHIEVLAEASNGREAVDVVERLVAEGRPPGAVLMDVRMPEVDGIAATRQIVARFPDTKVLVLTTFDLDEYVIQAVDAGASGFLLKDVPAEELLRAVRAVGSGDAVMAPKVAMRLAERLRDTEVESARGAVSTAALEALTERERQVFEAIAEGLTNAEIGQRLFLSESTVKTHVGRVLAKLQLRDRVHAVIFAYEAGLR